MAFQRVHVPTELRNFEQGKPLSVSVEDLALCIAARPPKDSAAYLRKYLAKEENRREWGL